MKNFFRKKIEQELRVKKWVEIHKDMPDLAQVQDQYLLCIFRNNSTQQTFDLLQKEVKDKKILL